LRNKALKILHESNVPEKLKKMLKDKTESGMTFGLGQPIWLIVATFLSIRSVIDPFSNFPFPRFFDIYGIFILLSLLILSRKTTLINAMLTLVAVTTLTIIIIINADSASIELLLYFKYMQMTFFIFMISCRIDYSDTNVNYSLQVVLAINCVFLSLQLISGDFYGVERAVENRGATFIEPAIGASGFTMGVLGIYFFGRAQYFHFACSVFCLLVIGSGAAFIFTILVIFGIFLLKLGRNVMKFIAFIVFIGFTFVSFSYYFSEQRFMSNIIVRIETVYRILTEGSFYLLGNRWINWTELLKHYPISLFGYGAGTATVIDNMYLKVLTDLGVLALGFMLAIILTIYLFFRNNDLVRATLILVVLMSLSHDILTPVRVQEIISAVIALAIAEKSSIRRQVLKFERVNWIRL